MKGIGIDKSVYGCASCGVWVKDEKVLLKTLEQLPLYKLSEEQAYTFTTEFGEKYELFRKCRGVTQTADGHFYYLYRPYMTKALPADDNLQSGINYVSLHDTAALCRQCYDAADSSTKTIPPYSLSAGFDLSLAWLYMPKLSLLEQCVLSSYILHGHIFKLGIKENGLLANTGHIIKVLLKTCSLWVRVLWRMGRLEIEI